jgi:hypothetical protein
MSVCRRVRFIQLQRWILLQNELSRIKAMAGMIESLEIQFFESTTS